MRARESSAPILYHLFVSFFLFLGSVVTIHLCSTSDIAARQHTHTTALAVLFEQVSSVFSTSSLFSLSPSQLYLSCGRSVSSQACGRSSAQQVSERIKMSLASWVHTHTEMADLLVVVDTRRRLPGKNKRAAAEARAKPPPPPSSTKSLIKSQVICQVKQTITHLSAN